MGSQKVICCLGFASKRSGGGEVGKTIEDVKIGCELIIFETG